jgi:hypothetical protein
MLEPNYRLRTDSENVAARVIEGEAIMIHLGTGVYYSMDRAGATMWTLLDSGHSLEETARILSERYGEGFDRVLGDVQMLAVRLVEEGLALPDAERAAGDRPAVDGGSPEVPYETPRLERYDDLGALLALDPPLPGLRDVPWSEE